MMARRRPKKRALKWTLYISSGVFLGLALLWIIPIDDVVMASGQVEPGDKVYIDSPFTRVVKKIYAWEGTRVKKGQPVALLEDHDLSSAVVTAEDEVSRTKAAFDMARARLDHMKALPFPEAVRIAEARLRSAQANLENERQRHARADSLWARKFITVSEMEAAQTRLEQARSQYDIALETLTVTRQGPSPAQIREAEAEVEAAEADYIKAQHTLDLARETLDRATLRSPEDGEVVRVDLKPGMRADQGAIVMIIAAGEGPILRAWVKETNVWKVRRGQPVEILSNVFSDREEFLSMGEVVWTYPYGVSDGGERTFEIIIKIKDAAIPLPLGSTADARVIVGRRGILKILLGFEGDVQRYAREDGASPPPRIEHRISQIGGKVPAIDTTRVTTQAGQ
jgi:multidrug resistance efflux pump